jgi:hypothetical protein
MPRHDHRPKSPEAAKGESRMMSKEIARAAFVAMLTMASIPATSVEAATFTFDPSQAIPALAGPGSAFTADSMMLTNYLYAVSHPPNGITPEHFIQTIDGFTLGGSPVNAPGLNASYGLYFELLGSGQPIGGAFTFSFLDIELKADVGYDNGTPSSNLTGLTFSNAAGVANDVTLATGSMISASLAFNPATGVRSAHFLESLEPAPGQSGFFVDSVEGIEIFLTTPPSAFLASPQPDGTTIITVNGGVGTATLQVPVLVPEPSTLMLILGGLIALPFARRAWFS